MSKQSRILYDGVDAKMIAFIYVDSGRNRKGVYKSSSGVTADIKHNYDDALWTCIQHAVQQHLHKYKQKSGDNLYYEVLKSHIVYYGTDRYTYGTKTKYVRGRKVRQSIILRDGKKYSEQEYKTIQNEDKKYNLDVYLDKTDYRGKPSYSDVKEKKEHYD